MRITIDSVLKVAGISDRHDVEVLRDGFPSYVVRVRSHAFTGRQTVILKACPDASREPDILLCLHRAGLPVSAVIHIGKGDGFRVVALEDVGRDALYKHQNAGLYLRAVREIAKIHRRFNLSFEDIGQTPESHRDGGKSVTIATEREQCPTFITDAGQPAVSTLADLLPKYGMDRWASVIEAGAAGTIRRLADGTYTGFGTREESESLVENLRVLERSTLAMLEDPIWSEGEASHGGRREARGVFELATLVHGDYHDGNVLIHPAQGDDDDQLVIVDWGSARLDSGFFSLVSLCDVGDRMGTCSLDPARVIEAYLEVRYVSGGCPSPQTVETEWHRCCILRAWDELRWFSESGEDFGDQVPREVGIMRANLGWTKAVDLHLP